MGEKAKCSNLILALYLHLVSAIIQLNPIFILQKEMLNVSVILS